MKKLIYFILIVFVAASFTGCKKNDKVNVNVPKQNNGKSEEISLDVMVTNRYLYNIVKTITGDKDNIQYMFPEDSSIKEFNYTDDSLNNVGKYDLFIYSGADFEPWISDFSNKLDKGVGVIDASRGIKISSLDNKVKYGNEIVDKNPYYWGDLDNYKTMLLNIKNALEEKDPKSRDFYEDKFKNSIKDVKQVQDDLKKVADKFQNYTFISDDYKFNYFFSYNNMKYVNIDSDKLKDENSIDDIKSKAANANKLCYVYDDDEDLQKNNQLLKENGIKPLKLSIYYKYGDCLDMMKINIASMEEFIKSAKS